MCSDVCLKKSRRYFMKLMLTIKSCCMVSITIAILVALKTPILLRSSWSDVPTLTWNTQRASISCISCNVPLRAQLQSVHKVQWSILWKGTCCHFWQADTVFRQSVPHYDVIRWMQARAAWKQKWSEPLGYCAACDPQRTFRRRKNKTRTFWNTKRKRHALSIPLREKQLWQENELQVQRQRLSRSRKIWGK